MSELALVPAPEGSGFEGSMVAVDDSPEVLRRYWMGLLGLSFVASNRCARALNGAEWIAPWAEQCALEVGLIWDCGRPR